MSVRAGESYLFEARHPWSVQVLSLCLGQEVPTFAYERDLLSTEAPELGAHRAIASAVVEVIALKFENGN